MSTIAVDRDERSIRVEIAGRAYPLTIGSHEEAIVQQTAREINESIARLKANYPLTDKQDLLAMAALEVAARALNGAQANDEADLLAVLDELETLLPPPPGS